MTNAGQSQKGGFAPWVNSVFHTYHADIFAMCNGWSAFEIIHHTSEFILKKIKLTFLSFVTFLKVNKNIEKICCSNVLMILNI